MRLFHILTRRQGTGKIKVTQKLLNRLRRETGWKHQPKPHGRTHHGFSRLLCASLEAVLALSICLVGGKTVRAAQPDQAVSATSGYSAAALFNQANAYARAGKPGMAILDYTRAQLLAPNDADIAANLHFVRAKAGLPDSTENWFTRTLSYARPNSFAWLGSFGLVLAGLSMFFVRLHPQRRLAFASLTVVGVLLVATAIGDAIMTWPTVNDAVVIAREVPAWNSPAPVAEPAFKLREGETVTVRAERQNFALVQSSAGRSGWVARLDLARVVPQSGSRARFIN
jgi:tetratricopeptide (TPR) repeat protein